MTNENEITKNSENSDAAEASPPVADAAPVPDPYEAKADEIIRAAEENERRAQRARIAQELREAEERKAREAEATKAREDAMKKLRRIVAKRVALAQEAEAKLAEFVEILKKVTATAVAQESIAKAAGFDDPSVFRLNEDLVGMVIAWPLVGDEGVLPHAKQLPRLYDTYRDRTLADALRGHRAEATGTPKQKPKPAGQVQAEPVPVKADEPQWEVRHYA